MVIFSWYQSIPSLTISHPTPTGDSCQGGLLGGVLKQMKSSIIVKILKKARFSHCLLNKWVAALFICLYMPEVTSVTYVSVNSKPGPSPAHPSCLWGRVFAPLSCPGVLNQSKSSIILKKARFLPAYKWVTALFIYARSEQCDLGPVYTVTNNITNTQRIRIYPGKLKFILVKISPDPGFLHGKNTKESQTQH